MKKIIAISDMHLGIRPYGIREREEDIYRVFHHNISSIIDEKPDIVIFCGDSFDKPKPSPYALNEYQKGINKLFEHNIKILYIIGNHTKLLTQGHLEPEKIFSNKNYIHIDYEDDIYVDNDYIICGFDYHYSNEIDLLLTKLKQLEKKIKEIKENNKDKVCILVMHQAIAPFCGAFGEDFDINDIPSCFDIVLNGHIHNRVNEKHNNLIFCQPGSLERLTSSEHQNHIAAGKGYTVIENSSINFKNVDLERVMLPYEINLNETSFQDSLSIIKNVIKDNEWDICENKKPLIYIKIIGKNINYYEIENLKKELGKYSLYVKCNVKNEDEENYILDLENNLNEYLNINKAIENGGKKKELNKEEILLAQNIFNEGEDKENLLTIVDNFFNKITNSKKNKSKEEIEREKRFKEKDKEFEELKKYFKHLEDDY